MSLLAYRDRALNVLSLSATARSMVARLRRPYRLAVETKPANEPHITFADDGRRVLDRELAVLRRELVTLTWCRGLAVHDVHHWRSLRP